MQRVFGLELEVKLDIFHAVKRVGEKVSKKHHLRKLFMDDWKLVFRDPSDLGKDRKLVTPSPIVLEGNLDNFYQQWKNAEYNERPVVNESVLKEMENIRVHMKKGCLSGIKPGRGTNRNEELHKNLNNIMSASRYGVELAYGLFTGCFFKHNEKMISKADHMLINPVEFYQILHADTPISAEKFGLQFNDRCTRYPVVPERLTICSCTFQQAAERINGISIEQAKEKLQVIIDSDNDLCDDAEVNDDADSSVPDTTDLFLSVPVVKGIFLKALAWYFTSMAINKVSDTAFVDVLHNYPLSLNFKQFFV